MTNEVMSFVGKEAVAGFRHIVIAGAIRLYLRTGMKANRAYTPTAMSNYVTSLTGKKYGRQGLKQAYADLCAFDPSLKPL